MARPAETRWRHLVRFFDHTAEAILITDAKSRIVYVNRSFCRVTGYARKDVLSKTPRLLHSGRQSEAYYRHMWKCIRSTGRWQGEIWNRRKSGDIYPEWLSITAVKDDAGRVDHYLAIFTDITLRKREERELYDLATHDTLTGLPNRYLFSERLRRAMARAKRGGHLVALLYLDLDGFKPVNDRLGHRCGDRLLQTVAQRLQRSVREGDTVARLGGDEFAVVLEQLTEPQDSAATAKKLLRALARPYRLEKHNARITASIGITVYPLDGDDVEILLKRADGAMYRAKSERTNDYRYWGDTANSASRQPVTRRAAIRPPRRLRGRSRAARTAPAFSVRRGIRAGRA